jgi:hypothetical protein
MTKFWISLSIGAAALSLLLTATPAAALNTFSFVSNLSGNNANSCTTPASACANIGGALTKTEPGGDIKCLDNHLDGLFTIGKPITIDCGAPGSLMHGHSGNSAITIDLNEATYPNGVVTLRNLNIKGLLGNGILAPGADGIRVIGGGAAVHIENTSIEGFAQQGIDFAPSSIVDLFVRDTIISNNSGGGIVVAPSGSAGSRVSLSNVRLDQNGASGLSVTKASGVFAVVTVEDTNIEKNGIGVRANGASAPILLTGSTVANNTTGLQVLNGGQIISSGNNTINTTNGAPTSTFPLK